jgi:hypothetical protein
MAASRARPAVRIVSARWFSVAFFLVARLHRARDTMPKSQSSLSFWFLKDSCHVTQGIVPRMWSHL